ncbi:MAG: hypothetical protein U5R06_02645 [candidate division KSB1 bacterium]|nr:hypothetical protein [candidate division KSB1 bacterium]
MMKPIQILFCCAVVGTSAAQGISRSNGLGVQMNYWNITGRRTHVLVDNMTGSVDVDISGAGGSVFFFSRATRNLFLEMSTGAVGGVRVKHENMIDSEVDVESLISLLAGLRYDIFSTRLPGAMQPYLSGGGGPYWAVSVQTSQAQSLAGQEEVASMMEYGWYAGGGLYYVLTNWLAVNADVKYHSIQYPEKNYSGLQLGVGACVMWGQKQQIFEIQDTKLVVQDIYPAYYKFYNTYPLALVTVKNLINSPIEVNVTCTLEKYSVRPKQSGFIRLQGGETRDIPVTAFFSQDLMQVREREQVMLDLDVKVRAASTHTTEINAQIVVHSRNAWDGEMDKLDYFLTPENEPVRNLARNASMSIDADQESCAALARARAVFNTLGQLNIKYVPDPNIPFYQDDRVQFPEETLELRSGDCDDLVVLYASLLESLGLQTAFVQVKDPEKELAHVYLMFNTRLTPEQGGRVSSNEKRIIVRSIPSGQKRVWIPVEPTLLGEGFEQAWTSAATSYLQEGLVRNGLSDGWVTIIDHH